MQKITNNKIDKSRQRLFDFNFLITIVQTLNIALHEHYQLKNVKSRLLLALFDHIKSVV